MQLRIYPNEFPLNGYCLVKESLYEGKITSDLPNYKDKFCKGISEHPFKLRYMETTRNCFTMKYTKTTANYPRNIGKLGKKVEIQK